MLKESTGLRNYMLSGGSVKAALALGFIDIYSGTVPATADAALDGTNTKLCRVSVNSTGTGLTFDNATGGVMPKAAAEVWSGVNLAGGVASFYRHVGAADDATLSTTQPRLQGEIANAGAELNLTNTTLVSGATQPIDFYTVGAPTL